MRILNNFEGLNSLLLIKLGEQDCTVRVFVFKRATAFFLQKKRKRDRKRYPASPPGYPSNALAGGTRVYSG